MVNCLLVGRKHFLHYTPESPADATRNLSSAKTKCTCKSASPGLLGGSADLVPLQHDLVKNVWGTSKRTPLRNAMSGLGVRERWNVGAISNGIALHCPGLIPYCATFFIFGNSMILRPRLKCSTTRQPLFRQACELAFTECVDLEELWSNFQSKELGDMIRLAIPNLDEGYEIHELFNVFDTDGDGIVSKDSFISCLRRNPLLIALFAPCLVHKDSSQGGYRILEVV
ncbi:hypothetical protein NC653_006506 [Populus alba x Populus x berolinensis]|uniref:EF-hand domain-containing protein n=1 Tax=Populus alba x Populus x berolinensis TaxID=444605 RepID=A0AAD6REQ1_9ROSI|nr:hypothetical protein NC653_006506 [Populus alba x Populus x berolinensis]